MSPPFATKTASDNSDQRLPETNSSRESRRSRGARAVATGVAGHTKHHSLHLFPFITTQNFHPNHQLLKQECKEEIGPHTISQTSPLPQELPLSASPPLIFSLSKLKRKMKKEKDVLASLLNVYKTFFQNAKQDILKTQDAITALITIVTYLPESPDKLMVEQKKLTMLKAEFLSKLESSFSWYSPSKIRENYYLLPQTPHRSCPRS